MTSIRDEDTKNFKIGDIFYECEMGMNIEAKVTSLPIVKTTDDGREQIRWMAVNTQDGSEISYLLTSGMSQYGPRLYTQPQYCRVKDGVMTFPLIGASKEN